MDRHRWPGLGINASGRCNPLGWHSGNLRRALWCPRLNEGCERFRPVHSGRDEGCLMQAFLDDHVREGVEQGHVGARLQREVDAGRLAAQLAGCVRP